MSCLILAIVATIVISLDIGYFIRGVIVVYYGRLFQRRYGVDETTTVYSICSTRDIDFFGHMHTARYMRALDCCKMHFYDRTDLGNIIVAGNGVIMQAASTIFYRGPISLFDFYKIETKILCWDDKRVYFEHKFITLKDDFVRAVVLSKNHIVGLDVSRPMANYPGSDKMRRFPEEVVQWSESLETTSARLRKNN